MKLLLPTAPTPAALLQRWWRPRSAIAHERLYDKAAEERSVVVDAIIKVPQVDRFAVVPQVEKLAARHLSRLLKQLVVHRVN